MHHRLKPKHAQKGATLIITLVIALVSLLTLLATSSTTLSTASTAQTASHLLASHELANSTASLALEALTKLQNKNIPAPPWYFHTLTSPSPSSWSQIAPSSFTPGSSSKLQAKFLISRQCDPAAPSITNTATQCIATSSASGSSLLQSNSTASEPLISSPDTTYVIHVQISDPKGFLQDYSFQVSPSQ